jgi:hemerythrin-like domain-containing protein
MKMSGPLRLRRRFLAESLTASLGILAAGEFTRWTGSPKSQEHPKEERGGEEVAPAEDLMREHGVLNRILLIYEESQRRLRAPKADLDPVVLASAAGIIQHFIEEYHEKLEEDYLFPRFEKAGRLVDLVTTLRTQHRAGRIVTARILALAKPAGLRDPGERHKLDRALGEFVRMYRPHEAREDTVLFPAFREIVSAHEYAALGEDFEDKEHELFGKQGFEGIIEKTASLEKQLGIYELSQFTPHS